jgi:alanyl-tRNA synthetase
VSLQAACELLKDIDTTDKEEKGRVTKSFLRKVLELVSKYDSKEEFLLSLAYMVARNKKYDEDDLVKFYRRLKEQIKELSDDWKKELGEIMQNAVKLYYVKAENLFEEDLLCTTK